MREENFIRKHAWLMLVLVPVLAAVITFGIVYFALSLAAVGSMGGFALTIASLVGIVIFLALAFYVILRS